MDSVHVFSYLKTKFKKNKNMGLFDNESYNTGRSWHLDRQKHNKSEDLEKPMDERKQRYAEGGGVDTIKFYELADILDLDLEYDGDETDLRLHGNEMLNWGAETEAEYKEAADAIDAISFKGNGWEVYAWCDVSGFNYWMVQQEEQNYINVTIMFDIDTVDVSEIPAIKNAIESAYSEAYSISEKYDYVPNSEYKRGGRIKSALMRDRAYKSNEPHEQAYERKSRPKNPRYAKYAEGGGVGLNISDLSKDSNVYLIVDNSGSTYSLNFDKIVSNLRGEFNNIKVITQEGLNVKMIDTNDSVYVNGGGGFLLEDCIEYAIIHAANENVEDAYYVILTDGHEDFGYNFPENTIILTTEEGKNHINKWQPNVSVSINTIDIDNEEYKRGGRIKSALMRDRAYKSNEPHEQAYERKSRPKNPRYAKYAEGGGVGLNISDLSKDSNVYLIVDNSGSTYSLNFDKIVSNLRGEFNNIKVITQEGRNVKMLDTNDSVYVNGGGGGFLLEDCIEYAIIHAANENVEDAYYVILTDGHEDFDYNFPENTIILTTEEGKNHINKWQPNVSVSINTIDIDNVQYKKGGSVDGRSNRAKDTWNSGASWTRDRNSHNKSEDWEKPLSERASANRSASKGSVSKGSAAKSKSPKGKSKNYMYIPNYMIRGAEVNNSGKTTDIDGANILDGIYVKKGTKYAEGGGVGSEWVVNFTSDSDYKTKYVKASSESEAIDKGFRLISEDGEDSDGYSVESVYKTKYAKKDRKLNYFDTESLMRGVIKKKYAEGGGVGEYGDYGKEFPNSVYVIDLEIGKRYKIPHGGDIVTIKKVDISGEYSKEPIAITSNNEIIASRYLLKIEDEKYAEGGGVGAKKSKKQKAIDLLVKNIKYSFVNTDMGSGWKFVLYAPFSTSGYGKDVLEEMKYLDMFDADDMGIEDYDNLSKKDKDYYYNDWKNDLFNTYFDVFKDKVTPKYLHFFEEELQKDEFGNGGNVGRDLLFKSKQKWEQNYDRKREWKEYKKEGWFANWFKDGGGVPRNVGRDLLFKSKQKWEQDYDRKREWKEYKKEGWLANWFKDGGEANSTYSPMYEAGEGQRIIELLIENNNDEIVQKKLLRFRNKLWLMNVNNEPSLNFAVDSIDMLIHGNLVLGTEYESSNQTIISEYRNKLIEMNVGKNDAALNFAILLADWLIRGVARVSSKSYNDSNEYAKGGRVKNYKYVPNHMIESVDVERNGKTTEIDGGNILDGLYVKNVKFEEGGYIERIPTETLEGMVGRKLNGWNDDVVIYNGVAYKKCFMQPYYKIA